MNIYSDHHRSVPQKLIITAIELGLLGVAAWVLLSEQWSVLGWSMAAGHYGRRITLVVLSAIVFLRYIPTLFVFMKRRISSAEAISVSFAFALYFVGFALLGRANPERMGIAGIVGIALFILGSLLNSIAELQRHLFKQSPENSGRLYMSGLFALSMHINYFGDVLWVAGYAVVTGNPYSAIIPGLLFLFFTYLNIPQLDAYLEMKYGDAFRDYLARTKRFIPWVW